MAEIYAPPTPQVCSQSRTESCLTAFLVLDSDNFAGVLAIFDACILRKIIAVDLFSLERVI